MKKVILIIGVILTIISVLSILPYLINYSDLSKYGKGYIVGKIILSLVGISLIVFGRKKKPTSNHKA